MIGRLCTLFLLLGLTLAGCASSGPRGFYPAIDCQGSTIAADFRARCGPYRSGLRN